MEVHRFAVRSAYRYSQADYFGDALIRLDYLYDEEPSTIRKKFTLVGANVRSFSDILTSTRPMDRCHQDSLPHMIEAMRRQSRPAECWPYLVTYIAKHCTGSKVIRTTQPTHGSPVTEYDNSAVPAADQKFLPDWPRTLAMSLARPLRPTDAELLADDWVGSEGYDTAVRMLEACPKLSLRDALMFAGAVQARLATVPSFWLHEMFN